MSILAGLEYAASNGSEDALIRACIQFLSKRNIIRSLNVATEVSRLDIQTMTEDQRTLLRRKLEETAVRRMADFMASELQIGFKELYSDDRAITIAAHIWVLDLKKGDDNVTSTD